MESLIKVTKMESDSIKELVDGLIKPTYQYVHVSYIDSKKNDVRRYYTIRRSKRNSGHYIILESMLVDGIANINYRSKLYSSDESFDKALLRIENNCKKGSRIPFLDTNPLEYVPKIRY